MTEKQKRITQDSEVGAALKGLQDAYMAKIKAAHPLELTQLYDEYFRKFRTVIIREIRIAEGLTDDDEEVSSDEEESMNDNSEEKSPHEGDTEDHIAGENKNTNMFIFGRRDSPSQGESELGRIAEIMDSERQKGQDRQLLFPNAPAVFERNPNIFKQSAPVLMRLYSPLCGVGRPTIEGLGYAPYFMPFAVSAVSVFYHCVNESDARPLGEGRRTIELKRCGTTSGRGY